jgi:hypothetical protein
MSRCLLHCRAILTITSRDKHHPTGVSFNKARVFKLKSMKNPKTKVGPALAVSPLEVHKVDMRRSPKLEDHGAVNDSYSDIPLQARDSHRRHTASALNEGSLDWSAQHTSDAQYGQDPHVAAQKSATFVNDSIMDHVELHTGQVTEASHLNFEELAFPSEIAMNDLVYDLSDDAACPQPIERRSMPPFTIDSCQESNSMLHPDDGGHYDILRTIQRIAEGRTSSGVLPTSMKLYIAGILESKRIGEAAPMISDSSNRTCNRNAQAQVDRVIVRDDALYLGDCTVAKGHEAMQLLGESVLDSTHHKCAPMSDELTESIFAVALGRSFATAYEGKLVTDSGDGDFPTLPQSTLGSGNRGDREHLCPIDVESYLRMMPGMTDLPRPSSSMFDETQNSWGFPLGGIAFGDAAQSLQTHDPALSDFAQMASRGIPTVGELSYLSNSGAVTGASVAPHSVASRHDIVPAVFSLQDSA